MSRKYYKALSVYRFVICVGLFVLFVAFTTLLAIRAVQKTKYQVGLKNATYILSEALVYVNFESDKETTPSEGYYLYLIDSLRSKFKSKSCNIAKTKGCIDAEYKTLNGKAMMSELIYEKGEKILISNILFMVNKPKYKGAPLLITVDVNGALEKPNKLGYDVFIFQIVDMKLKAMGNKGTLYPLEKNGFYCNGKSTSKDQLLGVNCTYKALVEPKYFSHLR